MPVCAVAACSRAVVVRLFPMRTWRRVQLRTGLLIACFGVVGLLVVGGYVTGAAASTDAQRGAGFRSGASAASTPERGRSELSSPLAWVRNLQRDLGKLHYYAGQINGLYTAATKAAVIRFQKAEHLVPDGEWGEKSQAALDKALHRTG